MRVLRALGANVLEVRLPRDLSGLDDRHPGRRIDDDHASRGLYELDDAIRDYPGPILGTCAGMIVLDRDHLDLADLVVDRNAYGRQVPSFEADVVLAGEEVPMRGVFIRAPRIRDAGAEVKALGELDGEPCSCAIGGCS